MYTALNRFIAAVLHGGCPVRVPSSSCLFNANRRGSRMGEWIGPVGCSCGGVFFVASTRYSFPLSTISKCAYHTVTLVLKLPLMVVFLVSNP